MNTSAHPSPQAHTSNLQTEPMASFTGTLLDHAQMRMKSLDAEGHMVPMLCMDLELDTALRNHLHVEQPFPPGREHVCSTVAHRYRKGNRVTVEAPIASLRMVATHTTHIHVHPSEEKAA